MLYTEETVRANIRTREGKRVFFLGKGDTLTPGARDYLSRERIEIRCASQAKIDRYERLDGGYFTEKPENMTHLQGNILVRKDHPRIRFRGMMDRLQAEILSSQLDMDGAFRGYLQEILELARQIIRCDVLEEPLASQKLLGLTEDQLRRHSHFPQEQEGQPHFMPEWTDGEKILALNRLRCAVRRAEVQAVSTFQDREGNPTRPDILQALNRMSSAVYILMIRMKKEGYGKGTIG